MNKKTLFQTSLLLLLSISLALTSCIPHLRGNGKVVKQERQVSGFNQVSVGMGINLMITQDSTEKATVEADENLLKVIRTEVSGGRLKISLKEPVLHAKMLNVHLSARKLNTIECSSGAQVQSVNTFNADNLKVEASSGANAKLTVKCDELKVGASSGSQIEIAGSSTKISAHTSSGSEIDAKDLVAESGNASSSSGSSLSIQTTKEIKADANSGSNIKVYGNPGQRETHNSSGGDVNFR